MVTAYPKRDKIYIMAEFKGSQKLFLLYALVFYANKIPLPLMIIREFYVFLCYTVPPLCN